MTPAQLNPAVARIQETGRHRRISHRGLREHRDARRNGRQQADLENLNFSSSLATPGAPGLTTLSCPLCFSVISVTSVAKFFLCVSWPRRGDCGPRLARFGSRVTMTTVTGRWPVGRMAKLADARDLKSRGGKPPCGFDSRSGQLHFETVNHQHQRTQPSSHVTGRSLSSLAGRWSSKETTVAWVTNNAGSP